MSMPSLPGASSSTSAVPAALPSDFQMVSFLRDDVVDDDGALVEEAPKIYEAGGSLEEVRERVEAFARHFDTLVREAAISARDTPAHLRALRGSLQTG